MKYKQLFALLFKDLKCFNPLTMLKAMAKENNLRVWK